MNKMRSGVLKIGAAERLGSLVLPEALGRFHLRWPNIRIEIVEGDSYSLEDDVAVGALDMAIVLLPVKSEHSIARLPSRSQSARGFVWVCFNKKTDFKDGDSVSYLDELELRGQTMIVTTPHKKSRQIFNRLLKRLNGEYVIGLETNNSETVLRFVTQGFRVPIEPCMFTRLYLSSGRICY